MFVSVQRIKGSGAKVRAFVSQQMHKRLDQISQYLSSLQGQSMISHLYITYYPFLSVSMKGFKLLKLLNLQN